MMKYIRIIIVLSLITLLSGLALGALNEVTKEQVANNVLRFKKIPAVANIYESVFGPQSADQRVVIEDQLLAGKKYLDMGEEEPLLVFVINKNDKPYAVTIEKFGQGFGGALGVIAGFELESGRLIGAGITTLSETPGVGSRVTEKVFTDQFSRMKADAIFKVKKDGGAIDAVTGATVSSRAVAFAIDSASDYFKNNQDKILTALDQ